MGNFKRLLEKEKCLMNGTDGCKECITFDETIRPNRLMCKVVGFWPTEETPTRSKLSKILDCLHVIFTLSLVSLFLVPEIMDMVVHWGDFKVLANVGGLVMTVSQLMFKMLYLIVRRRRIARVYRILRELWHAAEDSMERECFETYAYQAKIFSVAFLAACFTNNINFTTIAIVHCIRNDVTEYWEKLPFEVWYGFDANKSPIFELMFLSQWVAGGFCCLGVVGLDTTMMSMILHACGQFTLISEWIRRLGEDIGHQAFSKYDEVQIRNVQENVRRCVRHHQKIIHTVEEIDALLNPLIFVQLITSGVEICLSLYAVTLGGSKSELVKFTCYFVSMIAQLVVWCWPGELLISESSHVAHAVYFDVPWYKLPRTCQMDLTLVILRAQKFCQITAAKFQTMSIQKLTDIFNSAASYYALLRQVQD